MGCTDSKVVAKVEQQDRGENSMGRVDEGKQLPTDAGSEELKMPEDGREGSHGPGVDGGGTRSGTAMNVLLTQELREPVFGHLPLRWRAMLCRACKSLEEVVRGDGLDYGVATLCTVLAGEDGCNEALRRMYCANP
eukprot:CAMPEP_0114136924 /NCGR_PEP_ID=MMETSP0043_2-20121206/15502_1 /TAXON_ID=464988 /ORGANISM="Hemiselmis andersenii, Strain CCMP644" /LENGTH=135 /DNA_ID=CAMNT_0001230767 /DNA_START=62 /DNA_END=465 /DNA_ORIENTATION=+